MASKLVPRSLLLMLVVSGLAGCGGEVDYGVKVLYAIGGKGDGAWNDAAYLGLLRWKERTGRSVEEGVPTDKLNARSIFHKWLASPLTQDREIVVLLGHDADELVDSVDCELKGRRVLHFAGSARPCADARSFRFQTFEPAFLAGVTAMSVSKTRQAAAIGGLNTPAVQEYISGFAAGVAFAGGEMVEIQYVPASRDGFNNPAEGRRRADRLFRRADVLLSAAGATFAGVLESAKSAPDRFVVATDSDQSAQGGRVVIGSLVKRLDSVLPEAIAELGEEEEVGGTRVVGPLDGATEWVVNPWFADWAYAALPAAQRAAVDAASQYEPIP